MTNVSISKNGRRYTLDIEGHAGFNPGNDIVCAAVSMLACTLAATLEESDSKAYTDTQEVTLEEGNVHIVFDARMPFAGKLIIDQIRIGFMLLAEEYPQNINLCLAL